MLNRKVAVWFGAIALALSVAAAIALDDKGFKDEGAGLLVAAIVVVAVTAGFAWLGVRVAGGESTGLNAFLWTLLNPIAPKAARRARMLVRDQRDSKVGSGRSQ